MATHRVQADAESLRNLAVREPLKQEGGHLALPWRQRGARLGHMGAPGRNGHAQCLPIEPKPMDPTGNRSLMALSLLRCGERETRSVREHRINLEMVE